MVGPFACGTTGITLPPVFSTPTPANTSTVVPGGTTTHSPTQTPPTSTPTGSATATSTSTPGCASFTDSYGSSLSLANYVYYDGAWSPSSAAALGWSVTGGEFQQNPGITYSYELVTNSLFSQSLGDYSVEGDFKLDTVAQGVFGLVFRATQGSPDAYIFQWNGLNSRWEIEKQYAVGTYYYPGNNSSSPYTLGTWVHLKVTAGPGNLMNAWITPAGGPTVQIFTNVTDPGTTTPYSTGAAGIRSYNIVSTNTLHVKNFTAYNCAVTATPSPTPTCSGTTYSDNYSSNTVGNYDYYDGAWTPTTAAALGWSVTGGEFQHNPGITYSYDIVNNANFSQSLGDYRVEGDFKLDTVAQGVFGVVLRSTPASYYAYIFQWNGLNSRWEIEKQTGVGTYYYPGTNSSNPYTLGTWVHLKATASGNSFNGWVTTESGDGLMDGATTQIFSSVPDPLTTPLYATGGAGIRSYNIVTTNTLHVDNFIATTCP